MARAFFFGAGHKSSGSIIKDKKYRIDIECIDYSGRELVQIINNGAAHEAGGQGGAACCPGEGVENLKLKLVITSLVITVLTSSSWGDTAPAQVDCSTRECHERSTAKQSEAVALLKKHCTTCHTESRVMDTLKAMHTSQHDSYEKRVKSIVIKKIRLTGGEISHRDGKKILEYLVSLYG
jgi:hypothetical protein